MIARQFDECLVIRGQELLQFTMHGRGRKQAQFRIGEAVSDECAGVCAGEGDLAGGFDFCTGELQLGCGDGVHDLALRSEGTAPFGVTNFH
jgi:hypothetical protein